LCLIFLLLPIYWLVNMSFKTNTEIVSTMTLWPTHPTIANYMRIFTDESWYSGYINSLKYVIINTIISISFALPAAYAFSRYRFLGDKHLFFWLLSNRMAPPAVYALPFFNLYSAINLFDTPWAVALAHCLFNVPLAVWILEGFVSSVPREIDETAFLDGYSFPKFFIKILVPLIASGIGVAAFFCFMFSWVELLLARTLTSVDAKPISAVMTVVAYDAGPGSDLTRAWELALVQFLYFAGTVFYVKTVIRERDNMNYRWLSGVFHAIALMTVALVFGLVENSSLAWPLELAFAALLARAILVPPHRPTPKQVGLGEIVATVAVAVTSLLAVTST